MSDQIITFLFVLIAVLALAWILLPFLVAGINSRLDRIIKILESGAEDEISEKPKVPAEKSSHPLSFNK